MEMLGIILSLALLIFFAYRGFSVILFAPIFALLAATMQGMPLMPSYTELFMGKAVTFIKSFFPVFMLGAVLGKIMEDAGLARSIAKAIVDYLGHERAILGVVLAGMVLTYGGVSLFVVVFALYPFACVLFKEAQIPKKLIPATIVLGSCTVTMDAFPGTPAIQNIIPMSYFGTTLYAAPICGIVGGLGVLGCGYWWLNRRAKLANAAGEGYGDHTLNEPEIDPNAPTIDWRLAILPLLSVLVCNFLLSHLFTWDPSLLAPFKQMKGLALVAPGVKNVAGIWSLLASLVVGIFLALIIGYKNLPKGGVQKALNAGTIGSLLAIMNTASEVGYGNVIASLPGFKDIAHALLSIHIGSSPLPSEAVTVTTLAGITGSASGGMAIALEIMSKEWIAWAQTINMDPQIMHRVASMAAGGMDSLPHNGAIITILAVCGLTHKQSYPDIFFITCMKTVAAFVVIAFHTITGLY